MKGIVKWYSDSEGFGIIKTQYQGQFCFSIRDFVHDKPKEGKTVAFEPANKNIIFHAQQMPLAMTVRQIVTLKEFIFGVIALPFVILNAIFEIFEDASHTGKCRRRRRR